ncbi:MAG: FkbM family methyltransferase [Acetobacterium woodii]|nr:FkbM family methyltransferase [Acetobacterium woodii]
MKKINYVEILNENSLINNFVETCNNTNIKLALFGCGNALVNALGFLKFFNITPYKIIDNDFCKVGEFVNDLEIISYEAFKSIHNEYMVLIVPQDVKAIREIKKQLMEIMSENFIYSFDFIYFDFYNQIQSYLSYRDFFKENFDEILWLFDNLEDDKSKETLIAFLKGRMTQDYKYYESVYCEEQYFDKEIVKLTDNETFIDCGAWDGDTIIDFMNRVNSYDNIYCFEPDSVTFKKLESFVKDNDSSKKIVLFENAVWKKSEILKFNAIGETQSNVCTDQNSIYSTEVKAIALDDCSFDNVTQIKMDIEGSEYEALIGATRTIRDFKPRLTICAYHKYEDLVLIPRFIKQIEPRYKLFLRQHKPYGSELVLYAVVK